MKYYVKDVIEKLGITKDALYYYEKEGLLPPISRTENGNRIYSDYDVSWIYFIRCLRDIDMPIRIIKQYAEKLKNEASELDERKDLLLEFKSIIEEKIEKYNTVYNLINKKIEYYDEQKLETKNEAEACLQYREDWEQFKERLGDEESE